MKKKAMAGANGSLARRQRSKLELRQQILDAARELFVEQGYEAVTMRRIAARINYTPTTIYLHFKDKDDLCTALCDQDWLAFGQVFARLLAIEHPVQRLVRAGEAYIKFGLSHPQQYRWLFMTPRSVVSSGSSELIRRGDPTVDAYAFLRQTVQACIAGAHFKENYRNPDCAAQLIWAQVHGMVALHVVRPGDDWIDWVGAKRLASGIIEVIRCTFIDEEEISARSSRRQS